MYRRQPEGCTYALNHNGATQVINITRHRNVALSAQETKRRWILWEPFARYRYRARLRIQLALALPYGLAYAELAGIQRTTQLSRSATEEKASQLYWSFKLAAPRRLQYWLLLAACLPLVLLACMRRVTMGGRE